MCGRFDRPPNELFYEFQRSFPFDRRLLPYEIAVDRAWARAIARAGILKVNCSTSAAAVDLPFGGWKASGIGPPEHGPANREFFTRMQAIYFACH